MNWRRSLVKECSTSGVILHIDPMFGFQLGAWGTPLLKPLSKGVLDAKRSEWRPECTHRPHFSQTHTTPSSLSRLFHGWKARAGRPVVTIRSHLQAHSI